MAMSKTISVGSILIGCILLVLTLISVICGAVAMSKVTSPAAVSVGLWGLYFVIPGVLSIMAGHGKLQSMLGVALGTHILGIILAIVGLAVAAALWAILASTCRASIFTNNFCVCVVGDTVSTYEASCSDMETVRDASGAVTIMFAFIAIASFVGSIYGCMGTCCAPREPVVVVTTQIPAPTNTVVMTSSHQQQFPYGQQPPPYGYPASAPGPVVKGQL